MEQNSAKPFMQVIVIYKFKYLFQQGHNKKFATNEPQTTWSSNSDQGLPEPGCPAKTYRNKIIIKTMQIIESAR